MKKYSTVLSIALVLSGGVFLEAEADELLCNRSETPRSMRMFTG